MSVKKFNKAKLLHLKMEQEQYDSLANFASLQGKSASQVMREAIGYYLNPEAGLENAAIDVWKSAEAEINSHLDKILANAEETDRILKRLREKENA